MLLTAGALGLAFAASTALAQTAQDNGGAHTDQNSKGPVVVHAAPTQHRPRIGIPPAKAAAYASEAARNDAWRKYRSGAPSVTTSTKDLAQDYPGLRTYVPH